ncbi:hypothetical protein OIU78_000313 [Salix suchowensis]|nr:hypothetical protein OIU78_000313 [Salix suchowensis]
MAILPSTTISTTASNTTSAVFRTGSNGLWLLPKTSFVSKGIQTCSVPVLSNDQGQVKCGSCDVLLMYPYGASSVRCSSCRFVTEIGDQNRRPPWSMIQGYPPRPMSFNPIS